MKNYQRLCEVSGLSARELLALTKRIRASGVDAEEIRLSLNDPSEIEAYRKAGWSLLRGASLLCTGVALLVFLPILTDLGQIVALACAASGAPFVLLGLKARKGFAERLRLACALRLKLEGSDGWLWRFRKLLEYRDADGPIGVHGSLIRSCRTSRDRVDLRRHDELLQYWHWVAVADAHLILAALGEPDQVLDPYEETRHD